MACRGKLHLVGQHLGHVCQVIVGRPHGLDVGSQFSEQEGNLVLKVFDCHLEVVPENLEVSENFIQFSPLTQFVAVQVFFCFKSIFV